MQGSGVSACTNPYTWAGLVRCYSLGWNLKEAKGKLRGSWAAQILQKCDIVTTPGSGFGPAGEGFVRASAFAHRCAGRTNFLWDRFVGTAVKAAAARAALLCRGYGVGLWKYCAHLYSSRAVSAPIPSHLGLY